MELKKVEIHGFRSIEEMEISFDDTNCKILVGKNESGKSNILNALDLLSKDIKFETKDKKESYQKPAYIRFSFDLNKNEIDNCKKKFFEKILVSPETKLTEKDTVKTFFEKNSTYILYQNDCNQEGHWTYWELSKKLQIIGNWHIVNQTINGHNLHKKVPAESYINEDFINKNLNAEEQEIIKNHISKTDIKVIYQFLRKIVKEQAAPDDYHFSVTNWKYEKKYDLPSYVNRNQFAEDPYTCIPLKNMFLLANINYDIIKDSISEAHNQGFNQLTSLFDGVNKKTNEYIKQNWEEYEKEYKDVKITLRSDGENIVIGIKDSENTFDFEQRSDGYRRFISFLLLMSTKSVTQTDPSLILIDEPEIGLHPSSAEDLKNTLIKLSQYNTIVYATHSISMIDTESIENNLIISKKKENTTFEIAKEDGISPAENIFQAIGYSIYSELAKTNILLEGYSDKKILKSFIKRDTSLNQYGICFTDGLNNIKNVISVLDLASRKYFVLSDADESAKNKKKEIDKEIRKYWFTYKDLDSEAITIEDFYKKDFFQKITQEILEENEINNSSPDWFSENDRIATIKIFLHRENKDREKIKIILDKIKSDCIGEYKEEDIEKEKIELVLNKFLEKIKKNS